MMEPEEPTTEPLPPSTLPKNRKKLLWVAGGVSAAVLALCCGIGAGALNAHDNGPSQPVPTKTTVRPATTPPARTTAPTTTTSTVATTITTSEPLPPVQDIYYANCAAVKAAGKAPLYRGQPGYRSALDRDGDGVACES